MTAETIYVAARGSGWVLTGTDGADLSPQLRTQAAALTEGHALLEDRGGVIVVHGRDGAVRRSVTVPRNGQTPAVDISDAPAAPAFCPSCGAPRKPGSQFCSACGHSFDATTSAAATASVSSPQVHDVSVPAWLTSDWPTALVLAAVQLVGLFLVCLLYGLGLGATAAGTDGLLPGLIVGAVLPIAIYGGEISVAAGNDDSSLFLLLDHLPLLLTLLAGAWSYVLLRSASRRLSPVPGRARAVVVKTVVLFAVLLTIAGAFADTGDLAGIDDDEGFRAVTAVSQIHAGWVALLVGFLSAAYALRRNAIQVLPWTRGRLQADRVARAMRAGAVAWLALVLVLGVSALVGIGVAVEGLRERGTLAVAAPLVVSGTGVATAAVSHGGAAGYLEALSDQILESEDEDEESFRLSVFRPTDAHVSLLDWSLPVVEDGSDDTPLWAYVALLAPLVTLVGASILLLRRANPPSESWAVSLTTLLGLGYALASWVLSKVIGLSVLGSSDLLDWEFSPLVVRPGAGSSLGLPLLWAVLLCPLTGWIWARSRKLPGSIFGTLATASPTAPAPISSTHPCPSCGQAARPGARFCGNCGAAAAD